MTHIPRVPEARLPHASPAGLYGHLGEEEAGVEAFAPQTVIPEAILDSEGPRIIDDAAPSSVVSGR